MSETVKIQLKQSSILQVPFQAYNEEFTFIVNGEEFKTSRLISDLISPNISKIHSVDPTIDEYTINTKNHGHFSRIFNLINFQQNNIPDQEIPFFIEVIEQIGNDTIDFVSDLENSKITTDNIFKAFKIHSKYKQIFSEQILKEIDFISLNFHELIESQKENFKELDAETLYAIINNSKLKLKNEDQLLNFVNELYLIDNEKFGDFYESVLFINASTSSISKFIEIFDLNDITNLTWISICDRFKQEIESKLKFEGNQERYTKSDKLMKFDKIEGKDFQGIFNYLRNKTSNKIENEVIFTSSPLYCSTNDRLPSNVVLFEDENNFFESKSQPNSFLCFKFINHKVIPTKYTLKSARGWSKNSIHPRSWVIECSNDNVNWEVVDEQKDCPFLNGPRKIHTFNMNQQSQKEFQYVRIRSTGQDWCGYNYLLIDSFELYGTLI